MGREEVTSVVIGCDPDTTATGICVMRCPAVGNPVFSLHSVAVEGDDMLERAPRMAAALRDLDIIPCDILIVEWQALRPGRERNPNSMMGVMAVAGMVLAAIPAEKVLLPLPSEWRGTAPKEVVQARILAEAGIDLDSQVFGGIPKKYRSHCVDALGMCQWYRRGLRLWSQL